MRFDPICTPSLAWLASGLMHLLLGFLLGPRQSEREAHALPPRVQRISVKLLEAPRPRAARVAPQKNLPPKKREARKNLPTDQRQEGAGDKTETKTETAVSETSWEAANGGDSGRGSESSPAPSIPDAYFKDLRKKIRAHQHYPYAARRLGLEGTVTLSFQIDAGGQLGSVRIETSAAPPILQEAAAQALRAAAPFAAPGEGLALRLSLVYQLRPTEGEPELALERAAP